MPWIRSPREAASGPRTPGALPMLSVATAAGIAQLLVPPVLPAYSLFVFSNMLVFAIACLAFNLVFGTAGSLSPRGIAGSIAALANKLKRRFVETGPGR